MAFTSGDTPPPSWRQITFLQETLVSSYLAANHRNTLCVGYMTQRSPKRRREEDLRFDLDMEREVTEPVSQTLQMIMMSARTNLVAANLETLQVMNLRIRASHAVEDAAVAYTEQMELE